MTTIDRVLEPLAREARKYESAEEFYSAIRRISRRGGKLTKAEELLRSQIVTFVTGRLPILDKYYEQFGDFNKSYVDFFNQAKHQEEGRRKRKWRK